MIDKTDYETKEIKKLNADIYTKKVGARWDKINTEMLNTDKEIKTKSDRLVKALEDLKSFSGDNTAFASFIASSELFSTLVSSPDNCWSEDESPGVC